LDLQEKALLHTEVPTWQINFSLDADSSPHVCTLSCKKW
jgi:hypothetical protein